MSRLAIGLICGLIFGAVDVALMELDEPFGGLIGISSEPMLNALHQLAQ